MDHKQLIPKLISAKKGLKSRKRVPGVHATAISPSAFATYHLLCICVVQSAFSPVTTKRQCRFCCLEHLNVAIIFAR